MSETEETFNESFDHNNGYNSFPYTHLMGFAIKKLNTFFLFFFFLSFYICLLGNVHRDKSNLVALFLSF